MNRKSRLNVSHVPVVSQTKHPFHQAMLELVNSRPIFAVLAEQVRDRVVKITPNSYDHVALMSSLDAGVLAKCKQAIKDAMSKERLTIEPRGPPRPPPNTFLYGRIQPNTKVVDVGGGDGKRLVNYHSPDKVTIVDPAPGNVSSAPKEQKPFTKDILPEQTVVSFNAMIQGDLAKQLEDRDGIHVVPDHDKLIEDGVMQRDGDQVSGHGYEDVYFKPRGETFGSYRGCNTYARRDILFTIGEFGPSGKAPLPLFGERAIKNIPDGEATVKYTGDFFRLRHDGLKAEARRRDGARAPCAAKGVACGFYLEYAAGHFRLLAVESYRNYRPFHSLCELENFLNRVRLVIAYNGRVHRVLPPDRVGDDYDSLVREGLVEGKVFRRGGRDILVKHWLTFTVTPHTVGCLVNVLRAHGFDVPPIWDVSELGEVQLVNYGGWKLRWLGPRNKSDSSVDSESTILEKLQWPYLGSFLMVSK